MRENIIQKRGYSQNIVGDVFDLKIASYPISAKYLAERIGNKDKVICELCCGIGVSLIEFSKTFFHVIGIDNNQNIVEAANRNLKDTGATNVTLLVGDVSDEALLQSIEADYIAYDIPYWSDHEKTKNADRDNPDLAKIIQLIRNFITKNIVIYAPPHMDYKYFKSVLGECEIEQIWINGRHDRNFVFLGDLAKGQNKKSIRLM